MKILFTRFPLESAFGGAEVQTLSLMEDLQKRGHAVAFLGSCPTLLAECRKRNILAAKIEIGPPPVTKWNAMSFIWRKRGMQRQLEEAIGQFYDLDVVVMLSLSEKILLAPFALKKGIRVFWLEHDLVGPWLSKNPSLPVLRSLSGQVTTVVVSELSRKIYLDLGWDPDHVIAIPNGIDPWRLGTPNPQPPTPNPLFHIGCIARLTRDKGVDLLIDAVARMSDVALSIVGSGREEGHIQKLVEAQKKHIDLKPRKENLGDFYRSLDVLVLPSRRHDPFGLVAAEAMLLGIPVIVTDACGIAGYLTDHKNALIVSAGSSAALQEAIRELREDAPLKERLAQAGQQMAAQHFTTEQMINAYDKLLRTT